MNLTKEQKKDWDEWLSERPDNVKKIANKIVPWEKYIDKRIIPDVGNRYSPVEYIEDINGEVTINCEKTNKDMPFLGNVVVFGMKAENLIKAD